MSGCLRIFLAGLPQDKELLLQFELETVSENRARQDSIKEREISPYAWKFHICTACTSVAILRFTWKLFVTTPFIKHTKMVYTEIYSAE